MLNVIVLNTRILNTVNLQKLKSKRFSLFAQRQFVFMGKSNGRSTSYERDSFLGECFIYTSEKGKSRTIKSSCQYVSRIVLSIDDIVF